MKVDRKKLRGLAGKGSFRKSNKEGPKSRKELRKEKRQAKKAKKQQHTAVKSSQGKAVASEAFPAAAEAKDVNKKPAKENPGEEQTRKRKKKAGVQAEKTQLERQMARNRLEQLKRANEDEDKNIKHLEKLMKMNKRKSKKLPKAFVEEGLDYLLEVCDPERMAALRQDPSLLDSSDLEFDDDIAHVMGRKTAPECTRSNGEEIHNSEEQEAITDELMEEEGEDEFSDEEEVEAEDADEDGSMEGEISDQEMVLEDQSNTAKVAGTKVKFQVAMDEESYGGKRLRIESEEGSPERCSESTEEKSKEELWEDIYGRTRDKRGNVIQAATGKYVPPALRASSSDSLKLSRLKRQMQGLLNRVAESNMAGVASQIEQIILANSRGDSSQVLGDLLHSLASSGSVTPARMIAEHMLLLAMLHAHLGADIGAAFLQSTAEKFDLAYEHCRVVEDKTLNNLLQIMCFMYCFKMFHCSLLFDILDKLAANFGEKDVELILMILKTVGPSLRKDDPASLKNIIVLIQQNAASTNSAENSRVAFMLDVLLAIKNNNMSRIPDYDPDLVDRLRKLLRALTRSGSSVTELKISLNDLLNARQRGKWWVVGSAWQGASPGEQTCSSVKSNSSQFSQKLLDLARKQRMNTDLRRNIFCILMTAEDFIDAFEKLLHLAVKGQQEREIPQVILNCCLQEMTFNPYYAHLALKFCEYDRKFKMSIQCSIWDKIKELDNLSKGQVRNLASFTSFLVQNGGLTLAVLKVVEFSDLDKTKVKFIRQVLLSLLLAKKEEECMEAFTRVPSSKQLALFKEGIRLFLRKYILDQGAASKSSEADLLRSRVLTAERLLINPDSKVLF